MKFKKVVIIGMGLIGGSIGKVLLKKKLAGEVIGVCRRQSSLDRACKEKTLTTGFVNHYEEAVIGADLIVIATPVNTIKEVIVDLAKVITDSKTIITDVGSTKKEIVDFASKFNDKFSFVGSHPLAGSEKIGVEYSKEDLFENTLCIVTKDSYTKGEDLEKVKDFWEELGATVNIVDPDKHDKILVITSHLPHVIAYALAGSLKDEFAKYTATGFKDTTRIASSDSGLWSDIFFSNKENLLKSIEDFKKVLSAIEEDIENTDVEALKLKLKECKEMRDSIGYE